MWNRLTTGFKFFLMLVIVAVLFGGYYFFIKGDSKKDTKTEKVVSSSKTTSDKGVFEKIGGVFSSGDELTISVNTWTGFAPLVWLNGGSLEPNKESIMYKKYGILLTIKIIDNFTDCRNAFKAGEVDMVYCTTDALPVEMSLQSFMAELNAQQFIQVDWSRGGDLIVVRPGINNANDLKGKTIAVAEGTASNTFLITYLESSGLQMSDITLVKVTDGIEAAKFFKNGQVDAACVWTPDDGDCLDAIPGSKVLVSTKIAGYVIADGVVAKKEFIEDNQEALVSFATAWLEANGILNTNATERDKAAVYFADAFLGTTKNEVTGEIESVPGNVDFAMNGLRNVRLTTYGDNLDFFGLNPTYQGVTGEQMYSKMSIVYSGLQLCSKPVSWRLASNTSIIEKVQLSGPANEAEGKVTFTKPTQEIAKKEAISNKKVSINFATNSAILDTEAQYTIDREILPIAKNFGMARGRLEGNCDDTGNAETNKVLSFKRAQAVADYLVKKHGFDPNKFIVVGNGSQKAIAAGVKGSSEAYRMTEFQLVTE